MCSYSKDMTDTHWPHEVTASVIFKTTEGAIWYFGLRRKGNKELPQHTYSTIIMPKQFKRIWLLLNIFILWN